MAVIIPKKTDNESAPQVGDFLPISHLGANSNILKKVLQKILETGLRHVVGDYQTSGFKGISIQRNLNDIRIVTDAAGDHGSPAVVLQLDLSKVFDRVERPFIFSLLNYCGVGDHLTE